MSNHLDMVLYADNDKIPDDGPLCKELEFMLTKLAITGWYVLDFGECDSAGHEGQTEIWLVYNPLIAFDVTKNFIEMRS